MSIPLNELALRLGEHARQLANQARALENLAALLLASIPPVPPPKVPWPRPPKPWPDPLSEAVLTALAAAPLPLQAAQLAERAGIKADSRLRHHLAGLLKKGMLVYVQRPAGYWPAGRTLPPPATAAETEGVRS